MDSDRKEGEKGWNRKQNLEDREREADNEDYLVKG